MAIPILVAVAALAVVGVGLTWRTTSTVDGVALAAADPSGPPNTQANGAVRVGVPDAKVTVRVVMDLQCPACKAFETANGATLEEAVRTGAAAVEYNVISFLDRASTNQYSSRAGNAAFCVAASDLSGYQTWLSEMFVRQPSEGGAGLTDDQLVEIAEGAGYTDPAVARCITDRTHADYLDAATEQVLASGVNSTPTVWVDGERVTDSKVLMKTDGLAPVIAAAGR